MPTLPAEEQEDEPPILQPFFVQSEREPSHCMRTFPLCGAQAPVLSLEQFQQLPIVGLSAGRDI